MIERCRPLAQSRPTGMSASLIGRLGSSAFRLSTAAASMSPAGSRFSSESAPGRSIMGSEDEAEQSLGRPSRQATAGSSGHANSPHPSSREGHLSTAGWSSGFLLSDLILYGFHAVAAACSRVQRNSVPSPGYALSEEVAHVRACPKTHIKWAFLASDDRPAKVTMSAEIRRDPTVDRGIDRGIEYADMGSAFGELRARPQAAGQILRRRRIVAPRRADADKGRDQRGLAVSLSDRAARAVHGPRLDARGQLGARRAPRQRMSQTAGGWDRPGDAAQGRPRGGPRRRNAHRDLSGMSGRLPRLATEASGGSSTTHSGATA